MNEKTRKKILKGFICITVGAIFWIVIYLFIVACPAFAEPPMPTITKTPRSELCPDKFYYLPDTNGVVQLWEVVGSVNITNAYNPPLVKDFVLFPEYRESKTNSWKNAYTAMTIHCENEQRFYRLRIFEPIHNINGNMYPLTLEYKDSLTNEMWKPDQDVMYAIFTLNTNTEWRIRTEKRLRAFQ